MDAVLLALVVAAGTSAVDGYQLLRPLVRGGRTPLLPAAAVEPTSEFSPPPRTTAAAAAGGWLPLRMQGGRFVAADADDDERDDDDEDGGGDYNSNKNNGEQEEPPPSDLPPPVTREILHGDLMEDPKVKRRKQQRKNGGLYEPLDNRDHLPFAVRMVTPDPYTPSAVKKARQQRKKASAAADNAGSKRSPSTATTADPLSDHRRHQQQRHPSKSGGGSSAKDTATSRLYRPSPGDDDASTFLGEYQLDKGTTSGDVIVLGGDGDDRTEYVVQTARCQYKYAGGQRFVMVRKILEVKEVTRVRREEALMRQYRSSPSSSSATTGGGELPPQLE
jgi:hypothetical protein